MSRSPFFYVERFNKHTMKYELQHPIVWNDDRTEQELATLFPYNGHHELFSIVENSSVYDFPRMYGVHLGLPDNVSSDIQKEYQTCCEEFKLPPRWFTYADMYIYCLEHPMVKDSYEEDEFLIPNPVKRLKDRVDAFLNVMCEWGDWKDDYSLIRIVYWIG